MKKDIRVRFAPSPTGYLHIGGARTALYNWLFAKHNNGRFILRIEDTDIDRSLLDSEDKILQDLKWLGLDWDEGPYRQTQRLDIYKKYAHKLLEEGKAYWCYCAPLELEEKRKKALAEKRTPIYDGACWNIREDKDRQKKLLSEGRKPAIRFGKGASSKEHRSYIVGDLIKGEVEFRSELISDFIIFKSDGTASYNFAVVIDDALMKISHVIRGDEHLVNTPRQIMLYEALGFEKPEFAHIPMILAPDHTKLSKRHGTTSVGEFRGQGYLPEALVNYLALLGWSSKDDREIFSLSELAEIFSLEGVAKNPAVYDVQKLKWMNRFYIKKLDIDSLTKLTIPYLQNAGLIGEVSDKEFSWLKKLNEAFLEKYDCLEDVAGLSEDLFKEEAVYEEEAGALLLKAESKAVINSFKKHLEALQELTEEKFKDIMKSVSVDTGKRGKLLYMPVRAAVTGKLHGTELGKIFELIGKEKILKFIDRYLKN